MNYRAKQDCLGLPVTADTRSLSITDWAKELIKNGKGGLVTFINPHAYWVAKHNQLYVDCLERMDLVLCDGIGVVKAANWLGMPDVTRNAFDATSIAPKVLRMCAGEGYTVYLIGGVDGAAEQGAKSLRKEFPGINIVGTASGYFDSDRQAALQVLGCGAQVVICGMGVPNQERFLVTLPDVGWLGVGFTCGGFLDQIAGGLVYFPRWVDRLHLRAVYRLLREPRRLWRRYFIEYQVFIGRLVCALYRRLLGKETGSAA